MRYVRAATSSGLRRLALASTSAGGGGGGGFTPTDLFAAAEAGAWYDPSDLSTLWRDTGGTVAVTADGQSVARMDDKSGNGNHYTQGTASLRPVYKTGAGLHWLLFDGVDDLLLTAAFATKIAQPLTEILGMEDLGDVNPTIYSSGLTATDRCQFQASTDTLQYFAGGTLRTAVQTRPWGAAHVVTGVFNSPTSSLRRDGVQILDTDPGANDMDGIALGNYNDGSVPANVKVFSMILVEGTPDLADPEQWAADKSGVTL